MNSRPMQMPAQRPLLNVKSRLFQLSVFATTVLAWFTGSLSLAFGLLALLPLLRALSPAVGSWALFQWVQIWVRPLESLLGALATSSVFGFYPHRIALAVGAYFVSRRLNFLAWRFRAKEHKQRLGTAFTAQKAAAPVETPRPQKPKTQQIAGRELAFLAVDVVDSTGMKAGEDHVAVTHAFREFKTYVESHMGPRGCLKAAWTPDGVMCCFENVDEAAQTAVELIRGLEGFNRRVRTIRREFRIRCGLNVGFVHYNTSQPLEELCDNVVDVAGHLQKKARPNSVFVAKPAIIRMSRPQGFISHDETVDGYEVFVWEL